MSKNYNQTLQSNNTDLQAILDTINKLPEENNGSTEQATPVISVDNSTGIITATAGTKSSTHQLAFQSAKTITPTATSQIAVSSGYYTGGNITIKGDANLVAENIKNGVSIFGITGDYEGSGGSSGEPVEYSENEDAMVGGVLSTYSNNRVTRINDYAFFRRSKLTSISFPIASSIGYSAFAFCSKLTSVNFPQVTNIRNYAFEGCYKLTSISFPIASSIGYSAFASCSSLTSANFPACTYIGNSAFYWCNNLTAINFPQATAIGDYAFRNCSKLISVSFPLVKTIGSNAFNGCSSLTFATFSVCTSISHYAFDHCYNLKSLYLTNSSVCTLAHSYAFTSTPIGGYSTSAGTYGSIYVPASLLTQYQSATNWTYFSSRFVGI